MPLLPVTGIITAVLSMLFDSTEDAELHWHENNPVLYIWPDNDWFLVRVMAMDKLNEIVRGGGFTGIGYADFRWNGEAWFVVCNQDGKPEIIFSVRRHSDGRELMGDLLVPKPTWDEMLQGDNSATKVLVRYVYSFLYKYLRFDPETEISTLVFDYMDVDWEGKNIRTLARNVKIPHGTPTTKSLSAMLGNRPHEVLLPIDDFAAWIQQQ